MKLVQLWKFKYSLLFCYSPIVSSVLSSLSVIWLSSVWGLCYHQEETHWGYLDLKQSRCKEMSLCVIWFGHQNQYEYLPIGVINKKSAGPHNGSSPAWHRCLELIRILPSLYKKCSFCVTSKSKWYKLIDLLEPKQTAFCAPTPPLSLIIFIKCLWYGSWTTTLS